MAVINKLREITLDFKLTYKEIRNDDSLNKEPLSSFDKEEIQKIIKSNRSKVNRKNISENMSTSDINSKRVLGKRKNYLESDDEGRDSVTKR